ncbi:MAG: ribosome small subunit-dependent GTPase A [Phycisphaerae bacterium]|nr:ribosome small subunit-dependent GTPase A [Phycisphaerae bacterium]
MARRKGKSQRRIKDWQRAMSSDSMADKATSRGRLTRRAVKLPPYRLEAPQDNLELLPKTEGMVTGFFPGGAMVRVGGQVLLCGIAKTFRAPEGSSALAVGDEVTVAMALQEHLSVAAAGDKVRADGMILVRAPRRSALVRPQPRSAKRFDKYETQRLDKVLVANIDQLMIITSTCQPPLRPAGVDRFLIVAERGELAPLLVINKIDLEPADPAVVAGFVELGLKVICCSAVTGEGLEKLRAALAGRRSVLGGASGVGKSTLVNALIPGAAAATRGVRMKDERGRHTTAAARVYDLPPAPEGGPGGMIVDTPGIRELGIDLTAAQLPWYFPEFEEHGSRCHFKDCTHTHEPDCAVRTAVEAGTIPARRYGSYLRILETLL